MEALCPFHTLCPLHLFRTAVPELYPFTINLVVFHHLKLNMDTLRIFKNKHGELMWLSMNVRKDILLLERLESPADFSAGHHRLLSVKLYAQNQKYQMESCLWRRINMSALKLSLPGVTLAIGWLVPRTSFAQRTNLGVRMCPSVRRYLLKFVRQS